jgi:hypothetical protein
VSLNISYYLLMILNFLKAQIINLINETIEVKRMLTSFIQRLKAEC